MKKTLTALFTIVISFTLFSVSASAYSAETEQSIAEEAGADKLENAFLSEDELNGDKNINIFEKAFSIMVASFSENGDTVLKSFGAVLAVVILSATMHSLKFGGSEALESATAYISILVLSGVTYGVLYNLFIFVIAAIESLTLAMSTLMPIMASLHAIGGTAVTGAATASGLTMFLSVVSIICGKVLLPLIRIAFALCIVGAIPGSVNLSAVTNLVKSTATTLMAFIFGLLGFTLYLQSVVAAASDNYITRSIRFASGVFVPVIGSMLGDASRTVIASVSVVKGTVGASGVVIILSAVLPPLIMVVFHKLLLLSCAIIAKTLSCERESAFLYDMCGIINMLLALVAGAGAVCIIAMAVFVKSGVKV
jgi:stage III sporulation protein AE